MHFDSFVQLMTCFWTEKCYHQQNFFLLILYSFVQASSVGWGFCLWICQDVYAAGMLLM